MHYLTACFAIVGVVWALVFALRGSLLIASGAYLAVAAVFGFEFLHFDIAGVSLTIDRIVLLGIAFGTVVAWKTNRLVFRRWSSCEYAMCLFLGVLMASMFAHDWRRRDAPGQVPILQHFVEGYAIPCLLYGLAFCLKPDEREVRWYYGVLGAFGIYLAFTAVCEVTQVWSLVFPKYIADPTLGIHFGRARGPFVQSVRLGIYLNVALACIWIPWVWGRQGGRGGQLAGLVSSGLVCLAMLLTYTRSIWLGLGLGALILVSATFTPRFRRVCLYGAFLTVAVALPLKDSLLSFQREYGSQETLESTKMRAVFAYVSWLMIQDRPLTGFGFGHFPHEKKSYLNDRSTTLRLESIRGYIHHNTYGSIAVELGLIGLVPFLWMLTSWARRAWQLWKRTDYPTWMRGHGLITLVILATCMIQMIFHEVSYSVFENGALYLTCGLSAALAPVPTTVLRRQIQGSVNGAGKRMAVTPS